jgi:hypothetical protein
MGFASHLGPWLLGTVKNTTGTTAGTIRNMGNTIVCQTKNAIAYTDSTAASAFTIPAGSLITAIQILQTTTFTGTSGVITIYLNGTAVATCAAITGGTAGVITFTGTAGQMATWSNTGTTDGIITYTMASSGSLSAGAGTLVMAYAVRDSDGSANPSQV